MVKKLFYNSEFLILGEVLRIVTRGISMDKEQYNTVLIYLTLESPFYIINSL